MLVLTNRQETSLKRTVRPTSNKIIFISCEGQVTEETYFSMISDIFDGVKSKIRFISVMEEAVNTPPNMRTLEQQRELSKSMPWQLVEKINSFKEKQAEVYDFEHHPEDEFWIIADVDDHTNSSNLAKWNQMLSDCDAKKYEYAISNPFFEVWLLLHHLEPNEDDYKFAVTDQHQYEKTSHFKDRLREDANAGLIDGKGVNKACYDLSKIRKAISQAKQLHNETEKWPHDLGSTVYLLINKIVEISDSITS